MTFAKRVFRFIDKIYDKQQNPPKMKEELKKGLVNQYDIVYNDEHPNDCKLDVHYLPREEGKYPVIFEIHGGGFSAGDKKHRTCLSMWLAHETGAVVFNVNYGLGDEFVCPEPGRHLVKAFNWVVAHAEEYNLDLDHMVVTGDSAGGYASVLLSVIQDSPAMQGVYGVMNGRFGAAVLNCGLYDINLALKVKILFNLTEGIAHDFAGISTSELPTYPLRDFISPTDHITPNFPKTYVIYAEKDFFCGGQGELLIQRLEENGVYHEAYGSTKQSDNHTFPLVWKSEAAQEANRRFLDFVLRYFNDELK